jgi:molybdopterin-dependent oxidoreductase alpha subunit
MKTSNPDSPALPTEHAPETTQARQGHIYKDAAGLPAILSTMKVTLGKMGPVRTAETFFKINQKNGFDCQSCAWPSPDEHRHVVEFCENGAKAMADEAMTTYIGRDFFAQHSVAELAAQSDFWLNKQGRLVEPLVLRAGATHYEPIAWKEAFALLGRELNALASPNEAVFYTSGRTSNEAAFVYQLFARQFGTNNLPDCSNMCHESSGAALSETIGIGKGSVTLEDFEKAEAIFIIGQNPGTNHPRMLTSLEHAKKHGAKIVSINPLREPGLLRVINPNPQEYANPLAFPFKLLGKGTALSDLFLQVKINGDTAVLKGIMKEMLAAEDAQPGQVFDHAFIREFTHGYEAFLADLRAADWGEIVAESGISREEIRAAAEIAIRSERIIVCWAMGLTQHKNGVSTIREVVNFLLLRGALGKPGAGVCPVRGHSNVQGDRTMGIWEKMSDKWLDRLAKEFNFEPPRQHGFDTVQALRALHDGRAKLFFGLGGNFLSATPDTEFTAQALRNCTLTAHVSTKLNRAHLVTGKTALILPCLGRSEVDEQLSGPQFVTVEDSMGIINPSRGSLDPASASLLSEPAIICRLARATLGEQTTVAWEKLAANYDRIRDHIEQVVPGVEHFNKRIRNGPFYLPHAVRDHREFKTKTGLANFTVNPLPHHALEPGQYLLMTIRSHDQFNTTIYGLDDRYRGIYNGRRIVFMNADDVAAEKMMQGQLVDLTSHFAGEKRTARNFMIAPFDIPRGCTAAYFPEANALVPVNQVADISNTPVSKSIVVTVAPAADPQPEILHR